MKTLNECYENYEKTASTIAKDKAAISEYPRLINKAYKDVECHTKLFLKSFEDIQKARITKAKNLVPKAEDKLLRSIFAGYGYIGGKDGYKKIN